MATACCINAVSWGPVRHSDTASTRGHDSRKSAPQRTDGHAADRTPHEEIKEGAREALEERADEKDHCGDEWKNGKWDTNGTRHVRHAMNMECRRE